MEEEKTNGQITMDLDLAEKMLDEVQGLLEEMYELAVRAAEDDCTDDERYALQGRLIILKERIDETVDAYSRLGIYRDALQAAWKAASDLTNKFRS